MTDASVAIAIVSWNHRDHLVQCLDSIFSQEFNGLEIVLVDNGSRDGTPEWVSKTFPSIRLIANNENLGFSAAFNIAVKTTNAPLVLSLNPDVILQRSFLHSITSAMLQDQRIGIVAPKLLKADAPKLLDSTGLFIDRYRRPYDRGQGDPDEGQYDECRDVFGACGAAALYRRIMLDDTSYQGEFFDEDFFAYYEDADLSWRAQLRGWWCIYAPEAVALHFRGWGDTLRKRREKNQYGPRLALKNRYLMTVKNDHWANFIADLPGIFVTEIPRLLYASFTNPLTLLGILDLIKAFPAAVRKRKVIFANNKVDHISVRSWFLSSTGR
jgi:GT2 family glycosyltransferase